MTISVHYGRLLFAALACTLISTSALAEKPEWAGQGGKHKDKHAQAHEGKAADLPIGTYFVDQQRQDVQNYYGSQYAGKKCPPGLAKKNNGCQPPGQAKKWAKGQPLPTAVVFYPVPQAVVVKVGPPPSGHRYVRVANDLLLITIGTRMVVDAIEDLMRP